MRVPSAVLLDLDGTMYQGNTPLPGAMEAVARLRHAGVPLRFVTNTTRVPRRVLLERLRGMGIPAAADDLFTAPIAAAAWLRRHGVTRADLYLPATTAEDFGELAHGHGPVQAVVAGDLGEDWTFDRLNRAFRQVMDGATLVAVQKNRYWRGPDGLTLDAGPFVAALEYATGREAITVGKPSETFFQEAARSLGAELHQVAMVGDDVVADVLGAQACGAIGILVRTGKFQPADLEHPDGRPDHVLTGVAALPGLLGVS
jgi:phospholysine phosphohistidine inorganic pyrophosphate phosphatase